MFMVPNFRALAKMPSVKVGLANIFLQHTSASLTINENCDPDVRKDMEMSLNNLAPEDADYIHTDEGKDDMVSCANQHVLFDGYKDLRTKAVLFSISR
ncbi:secondary thiamine-phosphate synthase enzyme [Batrachochytrium salamandrivorans]|nr:secondary thiamine-phosphate synthase enzyme [Batrachochytrium salamandrivorans]KAJ1345241.1 secondary thiamine-phosphate synthase enzyme [Batrachochytrium salamandrivorans]